MAERLTSRSNPRVQALRSALQSRRGDTVGIEGFHLVREAIASSLRLDTLYVRDDQVGVIDQLPANAVGEVLVLSAAAFDSAAATESAQGIAALLQRPQVSFTPRFGDLLLLADGLQDPGNLGTLLRSAEAFGATAVVLAGSTVDPWNGKCLRASAGAAFRVPTPVWSDEMAAALRGVQARLLAAVAHDGTAAHVADLRGTLVLMVGNEGAGLSHAMLAHAHERICVATSGPTESLNAAVAGSVLLYEASRQRARA